MAVRRSRIWRCCVTSLTCSGRWPRPRRRGGAGAPPPTGGRVRGSGADTVLAGLRRARARARERAWLLRGEAGRPVPTVHCGGGEVPGLVIDLHARPGTCHSEKQGSASTFKKGWGYHPLLVWLDNTNEALAGMLRPGNAGSNTAADHIAVTDEALGQIPDEQRHGQPILIRSDGAGATKEWLHHLRGLRDEQGLQVSFSVGFTVSVRSKTRSRCCPKRCGPLRSTRPDSPARSTRQGCRSPPSRS